MSIKTRKYSRDWIDINHFNPSSRTPHTAKGGNNPPFAVGGGRTRLPHSPTAKGGPTLHGGWAYLHGGQSPISPQLKTNVPPPPAVFSCGNRNGGNRNDKYCCRPRGTGFHSLPATLGQSNLHSRTFLH